MSFVAEAIIPATTIPSVAASATIPYVSPLAYTPAISPNASNPYVDDNEYMLEEYGESLSVPIRNLPEFVITNGVRSGLELSSTTNAFPVPVCVSLTRSDVVDADAFIIIPELPLTSSFAAGVIVPIPTFPSVPMYIELVDDNAVVDV